MSCGCKKMIKHISKGVVGLSKAALRIDRATDARIAERRNVCRACEFSEKRNRSDGTVGLTSLSKCSKCGCFIAPKTTIAGEKCLEGRWT